MLSAKSRRISTISISSIIETLVGIASASFRFVFSLTIGIIKKLLKTTRNEKKKHNEIVTLAKKKLNIIKTLISQVSIDSEI